jgi:hypothetical protein
MGLLSTIANVAGGPIAGGIMDIAGQMFGNDQNMENQQQLNQQQFENQQALNLQGQQIQQENWDYTNYENQVKHIENAGLNVGMLYGMGGAGGSTMGSQGGGSAQGGQAPQIKLDNIGTQTMGMILQNENTKSQVALNTANAEKAEAEAEALRNKTPTTGNMGDMLLENMRQEGIEKLQENKMQAWLYSSPEFDAGKEEYNEQYDYHVAVGNDSKFIEQINSALFKTTAEKNNLDANALLTNTKAQGYWNELLNETKKANAEGIKAAAQKLSAEWGTGEFTNWKTWTDLANESVQSVGNLIKANKKIIINKK